MDIDIKIYTENNVNLAKYIRIIYATFCKLMNLTDAKKYSKYLHITLHKGIYIKKSKYVQVQVIIC